MWLLNFTIEQQRKKRLQYSGMVLDRAVLYQMESGHRERTIHSWQAAVVREYREIEAQQASDAGWRARGYYRDEVGLWVRTQ